MFVAVKARLLRGEGAKALTQEDDANNAATIDRSFILEITESD